MPLRINRPARELPGLTTVRLSIDEGHARIWQNSWKGQQILAAEGFIDIPIAQIGEGITWWVEASATSDSLRDISITLAYDNASDTVKATGMWMTQSLVLHDKREYLELIQDTDLDLTRSEHLDVRLGLQQMGGTGLRPIDQAAGVANVILMQWHRLI